MKTRKNSGWWILLAVVMVSAMVVGCDDGSDGDGGDLDTELNDTDADTDTDSDTDSDADSDADTDADTDTDTDSDSDTDAALDDICGFSDPVELGAPEADGLVSVPANHPDIIYYGRVDCSEETAPSFSFPGISIRMKFTGTSLDMRLKDSGPGTSPDMNNYYGIIIDGGDPVELEMLPTQEVYELARGLAEGEHTVEIFKLIEGSPLGRANQGKGAFLGFRIDDGAQVLPLAIKPHRVEFIGDSITCGYGDEVSVLQSEVGTYHYSTATSNAWLAWGAVAARLLDAEYMAVAYSGRGMVRNYSGGPGAVVPDFYLKTLADDATAAAWDPQTAVPELLVVNLGTNDFSIGLTLDGLDAFRAEYRDGYVAFLETLREYYPDTPIVAAIGPMISDYYPVGFQTWTNIVADLTTIVETRNNAGDSEVYMLTLGPQSEPVGADYHPTAATQEAMAEKLVKMVNEDLGGL